MTKILSLSPLPGDFFTGLFQAKGVTGIEVVSAFQLDKAGLAAEAARAEFILGDYSFNRKIDEEFLRGAPALRFVQQPSVGYQHIDVAACTRAGVKVANCAGANTVAVAEHTVMCGLALLKNLLRAHASTAAGEWKQLELKPPELQGKTWGLAGMGRIGRAVAERLRAFGVQVLYYDPHRLGAAEEAALHCAYRDLPALLAASDILSLHCPLTPETHGLINAANIAGMKQGAVLVNVARGEVIDEEALAAALESGKLAGAALDVYTVEPLPAGSPLRRVGGEKLILTPHIAGVSGESMMRIIDMTITNLARAMAGEEPENLLG